MQVDVPGVGLHDFPDDATDDEIHSFLNEAYPSPKAEPAKFTPPPQEAARYMGKMGPYGPVDEGDILNLPQILQIPGKVMEPIATAASDVASDFLKRTGIDPSAEPGRPIIDIPRIPIGLPGSPERNLMQIVAPEALAGAERRLGQTASGFTEPGQALLLPGAAVSKPLQALYAGTAAAAVPESLAAITQAKTPEEMGGAIMGAGADIGMAYLMGHGLLKEGAPSASRIKEATEVHGDLRSRTGEGAGQMPSESGSTGVQPQTQGVAEEAHLPLIQAASQSNQSMGLPHETVDSGPVEAGSPFAKEIATVDSQGRILLNRPKLKAWLDKILPENRQTALNSLFSEEGIHAIARKLFTDDQIAALWNGLSKTEQYLVEKSYFGDARAEARPNYTDAQMGHEYLRRSMQRLLRTDIREVAELRGKSGGFTEQFIDMAERVIQAVRKLLRTEPSKTLEAMLRDMEGKVEAAKTGKAPEGRAPAAFAKDDPDSLTPALKTPDGNIVMGEQGKIHDDIYKRETDRDQVAGLMLQVSEPEHGFWDQEKFIDRSEAAKRMGLPGELHSQQLIELQRAKREKAPAAFAKGRKKAKGEPEAPLDFIPPPTAGEAAPSVPRGARPFTPEALSGEMQRHLTEEVAPNYSDFLKESKKAFGGDIKPGIAREFWQNNVWKNLIEASGSELQNKAKGAGLQKFFGETVTEKGRVPDAPTPERIAQMDRMPIDIRRQFQRDLNRRYNLIARIGERYIGDSETGRKAFERTSVSTDDIADPHVPTKQPVWNSFTDDDARDPDALSASLVSDARAFGGAKLTKTFDGKKLEITQKGLPVSATKRLVVIQNKASGKVSMVSAFRDGRRGPVMLDPQHPNLKHQPIADMLSRYRVVNSVLLDEPVKNFKQDFKNLQEFERKFGQEARASVQKAASYEAPQAEPMVEEYRGPRLDRPITDAEAKSIMEYNTGEVGEVTGPEDILSAIEGLKEQPNRQAISGYGKMAAQILRDNPELSTEDVLRKVAYQVYENHIQAEKLSPSKRAEEFQRRSMAQGPKADRGTVGPAVQGKAPGAFEKPGEQPREPGVHITGPTPTPAQRMGQSYIASPASHPYGPFAAASVAAHNVANWFTDKITSAPSDIQDAWRSASMQAAPKITKADRVTGEKGVRFQSARGVARAKGLEFAGHVTEGVTLPRFDAKFGTALTEDNLRSIRHDFKNAANNFRTQAGKAYMAIDPEKGAALLQKALNADKFADNVTTLVGATNSPFPNEAAYQQFLNNPQTKDAIVRHKQLWEEQKDPMYRRANDLDPSTPLESRGLQTGARINLKNVLDDEGTKTTVGPGARPGLIRQSATFLKRDPFAKRAKGTGKNYEGSYNELMAHAYEREYPVAAQHEFIQSLIDSGNAAVTNSQFPDPTLTLPDGAETKAYELKLRPWLKEGGRAWLSVRKGLAKEYEDITGLHPAFSLVGFTPLSQVFTKSSIAGFAEGSTHVANLLSQTLTGLGPSANPMLNAMMKATGRVDIPWSLGSVVIKSFGDRKAEMLKLAVIGAAKEPYKGALGWFITKVDQGVRLHSADVYKKMAAKGWVEDTETGLREYVNQVGQYNKALQPRWIRFLRETGINPFLTAQQTFLVQSLRNVTASPGVKGTSTMASLALRADKAAGLMGFAVLSSAINQIVSGSPTGPKGTALGNIGWIGDDGKLHQFGLIKLFGYNRALGATGIGPYIEARRLGLTHGMGMRAAASSVAQTGLGYVTGPLVRSGAIAATGYRPGIPMVREAPAQLEHDPWKPLKDQTVVNILTALQEANPIVDSAWRGYQGAGLAEIAQRQFSRFTPRTGMSQETIEQLPKIMLAKNVNDYVDYVAKEARKLPKMERSAFVRQQLAKDEATPEQASAARKKLRIKGIYRYE